MPIVPLVLGTMAPDFEYILRLGLSGGFGHTVPGLVLFCLPAGLAAWGAFELLVRPGLGRLLPPAVERAVEPRARWGSAAAAILLGAASHAAWDSFTHAHGWEFVRAEASFGIPWYTLLQHGSTVVGGIAVVLWTRAWVRTLGPLEWPDGAARRWGLPLAAAAAGALLNGTRAPGSGIAPVLGYAALGAMAAFAAVLLLGGMMARMDMRRSWPLLLGCALGLGIAWVDARPTWDDTGITVAAVLGAAGLTGLLAPERPWLAAILVGAWVPVFERDPGACLALVPAFLGAYAGALLARAARTGSRSAPPG